MKAASPRVTSYHLTHSLVSELLRLVSLPSWPLALIRAKFAAFSLSFLPRHFPLSLLKSLYFSCLCPLQLVSYPPETVDVRQPQNHSSQLVRPAHSGRDWLTLMGDSSGGEIPLTPGRPWSLPDGRFTRMIAVQTSCRAVAGSPITPVLSVLSCRQEKPPWEQAEVADFY